MTNSQGRKNLQGIYYVTSEAESGVLNKIIKKNLYRVTAQDSLGTTEWRDIICHAVYIIRRTLTFFSLMYLK